jgi:Sec7-like guanine-nucleotide exchange factor
MSIPERRDEDTPPVYLSKLLEAISKSVVASLLARNGDPFHLAVLKSYMETFDFESDPMDMALRCVPLATI